MSYHVERVCLSPIGQCPGKLAWPELLGKNGKEAKDVIEKETSGTKAVIYVPQDRVVTDDYCCNRVRIYVDCKSNGDYENAKVVQVPKVGDAKLVVGGCI